MIKLEKTEVFNWEGAIRGMRNPLNSWAKSDSYYTTEGYVLGEADLALAGKLARSGSDHRKFLRQIMVSMDITAPLYWWKEFDTYKVGTVANSCSTMHKIHATPFTREDFSCERMTESALLQLDELIYFIETERQAFCETKEITHWDNIIQLLPTSYNQKRTITLNYEVLLNMYKSRKTHKLAEWRELCKHIETLPYFKEICLSE